MSASETASFRAVRASARIGTLGLLARVADAWPLAVIALGGVLSLAWIAVLAWSAVALVAWLV